MIELRHEFPVRAAGSVEVVITPGELLFQARDPLLECGDIGRRTETAFSPSIVTQ